MHVRPLLPGLSPVGAKSLTATFDAGRLSSDGGLIVLREIASRLGLAEAITAPLPDKRDPMRVQHSYAEMATARMLMIAAGYEDCDDVDTLRTDPALKIAVGRAPETGADLMSQPTLSRLENIADWRALARIGLGQIDLYCRSFARPPSRIVLDIDDTDDPVHGQQELALFNAHYDCTCFQPIHIFDGHSGKPVLSLLRPGKRPSGEEVAKVLRHVIGRIRRRWPHVEILVRGDSHCCSEPALALLERMRCDYNHRLCNQREVARHRGAVARPMRLASIGDEADGAPLSSAALSRSRMEPIAEAHRPCRGDGARHRRALRRDEPRRAGQDAIREGLLRARQCREPDQRHEEVHALRQDGVLAMEGQSIPAVPARRRLLAPAFVAAGSTKAIALAWSNLRDDPVHVRENRRSRRGAEGRIKLAFPASYPHVAMLVAMTGAITTRDP